MSIYFSRLTLKMYKYSINIVFVHLKIYRTTYKKWKCGKYSWLRYLKSEIGLCLSFECLWIIILSDTSSRLIHFENVLSVKDKNRKILFGWVIIYFFY